jgi:hypothetical protein
LLYELPSLAVAEVETSLVGGVRRGLKVRLDQVPLGRISSNPQRIWLDTLALHLKHIFSSNRTRFCYNNPLGSRAVR